MDLDALRTAARQQPFVSFTLTLADGRDLPISKPEHLAIGEQRVIVLFEDDSWCVLDPSSIVSLDFKGHDDWMKRFPKFQKQPPPPGS